MHERLIASINFGWCAFAGEVPYANGSSAGAVDPWEQWRAADPDVAFDSWIQQEVNGPLPAGLAAFSDRISLWLDVASSGITGTFPLDFSSNSRLWVDAIDLGPPQVGAGSLSFCGRSRFLVGLLGLLAGSPTLPALLYVTQ